MRGALPAVPEKEFEKWRAADEESHPSPFARDFPRTVLGEMLAFFWRTVFADNLPYQAGAEAPQQK